MVVSDVHVGKPAAAEEEHEAGRLGAHELDDPFARKHAGHRVLDAVSLLLQEVESGSAGDGLPVCDLARGWP